MSDVRIQAARDHLTENEQIVNIDAEMMPEFLKDWVPVEGIKLIQESDGTITIMLTKDLVLQRFVDEQNAAWSTDDRGPKE